MQEATNANVRGRGRWICRLGMGDERGQSLVELALVTPIFFALLLGAVELGRFAYEYIEVSNAARAGVAYGAQSPATAVDIAGMTAAAKNDAANLTNLTPTPSSFCSCSSAPAGQVSCASAQTTCAGSHILSYVQVNTQAAFSPLYPISVDSVVDQSKRNSDHASATVTADLQRRGMMRAMQSMVSRSRTIGAHASAKLAGEDAERGSSVVEFALASAILLSLVFGVLVFSLAIYAYHFISEAARAGTRYAMVRGSQCATNSGWGSACPAITTDIQGYVKGLAFPGIDPNRMNVTPSWPLGSNNPGDPVQVTVTYTFPLVIPFVPSETFTMTSSSQMIIAD